MKINTFILVLLLSALSHAQTKVIAHKSHSGSKATFKKAYQRNLFDLNQSNFGLPDNKNIYILDKVVALNDSITLLQIRESVVCYPFNMNYKKLKKSDFKTRTDTLKNHKIFNKKNTISFIKSAKRPYRVWFSNPIDSVAFVGFRK